MCQGRCDLVTPCPTCRSVRRVGNSDLREIHEKFNDETTLRISFRRHPALIKALYDRVIELAWLDKAVERITIHGGDEKTTVLILYNQRRVMVGEFYLPAMPVEALKDILARVHEDGSWLDYNRPRWSEGDMYSCSIGKEECFGYEP